MLSYIFHLIGTGFILYIICYLILEFLEKKEVTFEDIVSRLIVIAILFIPLLRT